MIYWSLGILKSCDCLIRVLICSSLTNDLSEYRYANVLRLIDRSLDMPKVLRMIDHILICPSLANDKSEYGQANVLQMIYWSLDRLDSKGVW